jgi:hypothetical protein
MKPGGDLMTTDNSVRALLERLRGIQHACDLDLLLFFSRHPRALLTSEQLVAYLGYDRDRVATSLDGLIAAGLVSRSQNPSHTARLYVLERSGPPGGALASLLKIAATREGRQVVLRLLEPRPDGAPGAVRRSGVALVNVA